QLLAHPHEELATAVVLPEQVPADFQRADGIQVERPGVQLLQVFRCEASDALAECGHEVPGFGDQVCEHPLAVRHRGVVARPRIREPPGEGVIKVTSAIHYRPLLGPARKPKPALCLCSCGSFIISSASSRWAGGITKRSSKVHSEVSW